MKKTKYRFYNSDYFTFVIASLLAVATVCVITGLILFNSFERRIHNEVSLDAGRIETVLSEVFNISERLVTSIGSQIAESNYTDLDNIKNIFEKDANISSKEDNTFSWSLYDWIDVNNQQLINSRKGILNTPIDMSDRAYIKAGIKAPWELHFSKPAVGKPSGIAIIPAGITISDDNGKRLGVVSMGFSIAKLTAKIEHLLNTNLTNFVVLDEANNIVTQSQNPPISLTEESFDSFFKEALIPDSKEGNLQEAIKIGDVELFHYRRMESKPYIILTGYNNAFLMNEFRITLLPRILELIIIGGLAIVLLYFFMKRIVSPISELSKTAVAIARGDDSLPIPRLRGRDMSLLAKALVKSKSYKKRDKETNKKLIEAIKDLHKSEIEKEEFVRQLQSTLEQPLRTLKITSSSICKMIESHDAFDSYVQAISDSIQQIEYYTADRLYTAKADINQIIERCILIEKANADKHDFQIRNLAEETPFPEIRLDKLRTQQALLCVLHHLLLIAPEKRRGNEITISTSVNLIGSKASSLIIIIKDNGLGVDRDQFIDLWEEKYDSVNMAYKQNLEVAEQLIEMHHGSIKLKASAEKGTKFIIEIPYLTKDEMEAPPLVEGNHSASNPRSIKSGSGNVLNFPKKD